MLITAKQIKPWHLLMTNNFIWVLGRYLRTLCLLCANLQIDFWPQNRNYHSMIIKPVLKTLAWILDSWLLCCFFLKWFQEEVISPLVSYIVDVLVWSSFMFLFCCQIRLKVDILKVRSQLTILPSGEFAKLFYVSGNKRKVYGC